MNALTLTKSGKGTVTFEKVENGTRITTSDGIPFTVCIEEANEKYRQYLAKGYRVKVNSPKTGKVETADVEKTTKENPRFKWNKEGRKIWAVQYNIYKKCLQDSGYAKDLKGKEYHDKIDKVCKEQMKIFESKMYKIVNQTI